MSSGFTPLVSVTVPVFNGEKYLPAALESLYAQNYAALEIIVVDDGSTDGTPELIRSQGERIRSIRQENRGPAAAVNTGIRQARGEILAFLDADDLWDKGLLAALVPRLVSSPDLDIATGLTQRLRGDCFVGEPHRGLYFGSSLIRRRVFHAVGMLDEGLIFSEDADWFLKALESGARACFFPETVFYYRQHEKNLTLDRQSTRVNYIAALKRSLDRRRKSSTLVQSLTIDRQG